MEIRNCRGAFPAVFAASIDEACAYGAPQIVNNFTQQLVLTNFAEIYFNGTRFGDLQQVKDNFVNINPPQNASALHTAIQEVPERGIEALLNESPPNVTQLFNGAAVRV